MPISNASNLGDRSVVFTLADVGCKFHHGAFSFAHYNVVYFRVLQHAVGLVGGMPPADYHLAGGKRLFNSLSCFDTSAVSCGATGYADYFGVKPLNFEFNVVDWFFKQIIVKDFYLKTTFFESRGNVG